jgi:hypothetical protein
MPRDEDEDRIFEARASGRTARDVAREFDVTVKQVNDIVETKVDELHSGAGLRQSVGFALYRLEKMELKFHARAMADDGDCASAAIALKANERRATLSGSNAPLGHSIQLIGGAAPEPLTSTQSLQKAFDEIRFVSPRERELRDRARYGDHPLDESEQAELAELQAESKRKREAEAGAR